MPVYLCMCARARMFLSVFVYVRVVDREGGNVDRRTAAADAYKNLLGVLLE